MRLKKKVKEEGIEGLIRRIKIKKKVFRRRRRMPKAGMLVQMDSSLVSMAS
ncbi:MAG: hypothetical protein V2A53_00955 [bacterium]